MTTNLLGERVEWRYAVAPECYGTGRIRAVYADASPDKVARVLVEVFEGRAGVETGDLIDLSVNLVRITRREW